MRYVVPVVLVSDVAAPQFHTPLFVAVFDAGPQIERAVRLDQELLCRTEGGIAGRATNRVNGVTIGSSSFFLLFGGVGMHIWVLGERFGRG